MYSINTTLTLKMGQPGSSWTDRYVCYDYICKSKLIALPFVVGSFCSTTQADY